MCSCSGRYRWRAARRILARRGCGQKGCVEFGFLEVSLLQQIFTGATILAKRSGSRDSENMCVKSKSTLYAPHVRISRSPAAKMGYDGSGTSCACCRCRSGQLGEGSGCWNKRTIWRSGIHQLALGRIDSVQIWVPRTKVVVSGRKMGLPRHRQRKRFGTARARYRAVVEWRSDVLTQKQRLWRRWCGKLLAIRILMAP